MNNELIIRTSKGEYHPGDTVFGAVYLRICRPTEGLGIKITLRGTEICQYDFKCVDKKTYKHENDLVDISDATLYTQDSCFDFGCYVFPFKCQLPQEIAGTFACSGRNEETTWSGKVSYNIKAYVIGSEATQATQLIIVYQCQQEQYKESSLGTAANASFKLQRLFKKDTVHITGKLLENFTESGSNLKVRLIVTSNSRCILTSLEVKLHRSLKLTFHSDGIENQNLIPNMEMLGSKIQVRPEYRENQPSVVHTISASSDSLMVGCGGIDGLQVPLREKIASGEAIDIPPTVHGKCVENYYGLEISVTFNNGHKETLLINIPGVLPKKNEQWLNWTEPDWVSKCEIKSNDTPFSVPEHRMYSEDLSGLPMFQVL